MERKFNKLSDFGQLWTATSMVKYSFVVQRSITYLDLSLREFSKSKIQGKLKFIAAMGDPKFLYTEEACKLDLARDRKVLYDYHLDVSKELELSLRYNQHQKVRECYSGSVLVNRVVIESYMYESDLNRLIERALAETNQKVKLIQHVSKVAKLLKFISKNETLLFKGLIILCFQHADSTVLKDFLTAMNFDSEHLFLLPIDVFEYILYQACVRRYKLWSSPSCLDPLHAAIKLGMFVKAECLFQFYSHPRFCEIMYHDNQKNRRFSLPGGVKVSVEKGLLTRQRHFLLSQIIRGLRSDRSGGLKVLQMLWRSIPDPFFTLDELTSALSNPSNPNDIQVIRKLMAEVTGEYIEEQGYQPRQLQHYCRIVIRGALSNSGQLSTGIAELNLPPPVKAFLRLEK